MERMFLDRLGYTKVFFDVIFATPCQLLNVLPLSRSGINRIISSSLVPLLIF